MEVWVFFYMLAHMRVIKPHLHFTLRIISGRAAVLLPDVGALACIQGSWEIVEDRMDVDGYTKKDNVNAIECLEGVLFPSHLLLPLGARYPPFFCAANFSRTFCVAALCFFFSTVNWSSKKKKRNKSNDDTQEHTTTTRITRGGCTKRETHN